MYVTQHSLCSLRPNYKHVGLTEVPHNRLLDPVQFGWSIDYDCAQVQLPDFCTDSRESPNDLRLVECKFSVMCPVLQQGLTAQVGRGKQAYDNAKIFVKQWKHMGLGWLDTNRPPVEVRRADTS